MKLTTRRLILRSPTMRDAKGYLECQKDKVAQKGFMNAAKNLKEAKLGIKEMLAAAAKKQDREECFAIEINGEFAGFVTLHDLNKKHHEHKGILGYALNKKFRGKGIMTKAVKLVTAYAFKKYKLKRLSGLCRTFNKASARVMEKAGYKLEGIMRKNKKKNGKYLDDMIWAKVK